MAAALATKVLRHARLTPRPLEAMGTSPSSSAGRGRRVDVYEAAVVLRDPLRCGIALDATVEVTLESVPPDSSPDREPDVARNAGPLSQSVVDRGVVRSPSKDHAGNATSATLLDELRDPLAVFAIVDAF